MHGTGACVDNTITAQHLRQRSFALAMTPNNPESHKKLILLFDGMNKYAAGLRCMCQLKHWGRGDVAMLGLLLHRS